MGLTLAKKDGVSPECCVCRSYAWFTWGGAVGCFVVLCACQINGIFPSHIHGPKVSRGLLVGSNKAGDARPCSAGRALVVCTCVSPASSTERRFHGCL